MKNWQYFYEDFVIKFWYRYFKCCVNNHLIVILVHFPLPNIKIVPFKISIMTIVVNSIILGATVWSRSWPPQIYASILLYLHPFFSKHESPHFSDFIQHHPASDCGSSRCLFPSIFGKVAFRLMSLSGDTIAWTYRTDKEWCSRPKKTPWSSSVKLCTVEDLQDISLTFVCMKFLFRCLGFPSLSSLKYILTALLWSNLVTYSIIRTSYIIHYR